MDCFVRMLNASPKNENIDIYVNGESLVDSLSYKAFTAYVAVEEGMYRFEIGGAADNSEALFEQTIELIGGIIYTIAFTGADGEYFLEPILDEADSRAADDESKIRFINLSSNPAGEEYDVYLNEAVVISGLEYMEVSNYLDLVPGNYVLEVKDAIGENILYHPNMLLKAGNNYAGYIVGGNQILLPLEGSSYL